MNHQIFLFFQWFKRDLAGRYRGSWLGLSWLFVQPLAQIGVFTLIFHGFMRVRWPLAAGAQQGDAWTYALNTLAGLAVFNFFAEVLTRAPIAVLSQPNLVTKVRFPLPILPLVTVSVALVHVGVGVVLLAAVSIATGNWSGTYAWLALWLPPVLLYGTSIAFLLASAGLYVRDLGQAMPAVSSLLMLLTPIFYPMSAVPANLRDLFEMNPVAWAVESLRGFMLADQGFEWSQWGAHLIFSILAVIGAYWVFRRLQAGFADVL